MALNLHSPLWLCSTCARVCLCEGEKGGMKERAEEPLNPEPLDTRGRERRVRHKWLMVEDSGNALS